MGYCVCGQAATEEYAGRLYCDICYKEKVEDLAPQDEQQNKLKKTISGRWIPLQEKT
jgi:uncharacterized Zn finger protein (UPF0148 family)